MEKRAKHRVKTSTLMGILALLLSLVIVLSLVTIIMLTSSEITGETIVETEEEFLIDPFETEELHWDHMPLTYNYDSCNEVFEGRIVQDIENSLEFITERTDNTITFKKANGSADITFICDIGGVRRTQLLGHYTYAEAVPYTFTNTNTYAKGEIYIYSTYECLGERPTLIIHEVGHLLGLDHNIDPSHSNDLMHPYIRNNCDADFLDEDIEYLMEIYN